MMRRALAGLLAAACALPLVDAAAAAALPGSAGSAAPAFALDGRKGPVTLADYRGKYVYLDFWASWCAPCKRSFPWMDALQKRYGDQLQVVAVNVDAKRADADAFLAQTPASFVVGFDPTGAVAKQYAIKGMPSSVLIDPAGQVVAVHAGFTDDSAARIEAQVAAAIPKEKR
jgi:cytochrome c biogenesis protein CcmG/thiol:disulfide interchange protein DsbE